MSLFPAYSQEGKDVENETVKTVPSESKDNNWLTNSSFGLVTSTSVQNEVVISAKNLHEHEVKKIESKLKGKYKSKKIKKGKKKKRDCSPTPIVEVVPEETDLYYVDKTRRVQYLSYKTLTKPIKPRYNVDWANSIGPVLERTNKKQKLTRYFVALKKEIKDSEVSAEEELTVIKKAEDFNKRLCNSSEISDWISFVNFQNEFFRSQHISYSTESERKRAIMQKKLDILEKAMSYNPGNEQLLKIWLSIGNEILAPDKLLMHIQKMLEDSPDNISLWLSLISVKQQSLSLCTFPAVTDLYRKAINALKNIKATNIAEKDSLVLDLLFHYCRFLDHCGHWEILWTIIKNNLHLNMGSGFNAEAAIDEEKVKKMEDEIVSNENQPIWVTWRRVETLREGVHFLPVTGTADDPQRCVTTDDIIDFVLHFHRDLHFRIIITFITLLKVPLLPLTNTIFEMLYKDALPWTLDSAELILSSVFHSPAADVKFHFLRHVSRATSGPQYLRRAEGQPEFLELVQKTFEECMKFLTGNQKTFLGLWWLRFNRWLCILDRHCLASLHLPAKKMKHIYKDFMKNEENRDNLLFYCEYSLFEFNQGNVETSIKTLKTLIASRSLIYHLTNQPEKAALCYVYKSLCEIYVTTGQRENAVKLLTNFGRGAAVDTEVTKESIKVALYKYEHIGIELVNEMKDFSPPMEEFFIPQYSLEWISCFMWLLALTKSTALMRNYVQDVTSSLNDTDSLYLNYAREQLWQTASTIYWALERNNVLLVTQVIKEALFQFPYNLQILSLLASKKLDDHGLWWTFKQSFLNPPTMFGCAMLICVALERKETDREAFHNRLTSLFKQLALNDGKLCSIIHNLRFRFLFENDNTQLDVAQVNAMESCPWNKSVYMGAISALPNKLMELTDVMIEKELRIHITPDEIQEMRD